MSGNNQPNQQQATPIPPNVSEEDRWTSSFSGMHVDRGPRLLGGSPSTGSKPLPPTPPREGRPPLSTGSKPLPPTPPREGRPPLSTDSKPLPPTPPREGRPPLSTDSKPLPPTPPREGRPPLSTGSKPLPPTPPREGRPPLSTEPQVTTPEGGTPPTEPQVTTPPTVEPERTEFQDKLNKLGETLGKIDERVKKLTSPPAAVTKALKAATDARGTAEKAGEAKPADWPAANASLEELQKKLDAVNTACLDEAGKLAKGFDQRFADKDKHKPAGKDIVAKYTAYGKARKALQGQIAGKDGLAALEACPATETALAEFETAAAPSSQVKRQKAEKAFDDLKKLSDEDLGKKSLQEQAELALDLCANGTPSGSVQVSSNPAKFLPAPGSTLEQLTRLYKHSKPDEKFMNKRAQQREQIADEVAKMEEIKKLHKPNGDLDVDYWNNFTSDGDKVIQMLKKICDVQADALGMARISVTQKPIPGAKNGNMGGYDPATNSITVNCWPGYLKPVSEALDTIIHETFHAHQDVIVKKLKAGEIAPGDDDYATAMMYMVNDIPVGYVGSGTVGSENYKTQPTEFDSFHHAGKTIESLMVKAKAGAQGTGG